MDKDILEVQNNSNNINNNKKADILGVASIVLSVFAIILEMYDYFIKYCQGFYSEYRILMGIIAMFCSVYFVKHSQRKTMAIVGIILSVIAIIFGVYVAWIYPHMAIKSGLWEIG